MSTFSTPVRRVRVGVALAALASMPLAHAARADVKQARLGVKGATCPT